MIHSLHTVLAIESSCDETAVSIIRGDGSDVEILCSEISSQIEIHSQYGGVVPELASRNHSLKVRPLIEQSLKVAGVSVGEVDCFCATAGPGLASSLLVGHTVTKAMALATGRPFVSINHMEGHLLSPFIESKEGIMPNVALVVSGGHTMLIHTRGFGDYELLGKTLDDAAGEAFDKVAKMLELPYPGGPEIEKQARQGDPIAFKFPRSLMKKVSLDFSFSGLKTAVLYTLSELCSDKGSVPSDRIPDICASFQQAVIDVLVRKTIMATKAVGENMITLSGGVSCNQALRDAFKAACEKEGFCLKVCDPSLSTDNAAMIAYVGLQKHLRSLHDSLDCDVDPNMLLNSIKLRK